MHILLILVSASFVIAAKSASGAFNTSSTKACQYFNTFYPNSTYFSNETLYTEANDAYYTSSAWLGPACVFAPTSAREMSQGVKVLTYFNTHFAIRGGGHMPISDAANINSSGVLLSTSGLTQINLSSDQTSVSIGPGNRWANVYKYLEPFGLSVVGGRMGVVGVPGLLLGGGISFFGNEYGWASNNVVKFECVLANGDIVEATGTNEHSDLFWALKGGGNSFCLVTKFELRTLSVPAVYVGEVDYGDSVRSKFLDAVFTFAVNGSADVKAAIVPIVRWGPSQGGPTYNTWLFHNGNQLSPVALQNFTAPNMMPSSNTFSYRSMYGWTQETDPPMSQIHGFRQRFYVTSITASLEAMSIIHDTYFTAAQAQLSNVTNFFTGVAFMPISENYIAAGNKRGGDPMGVDTSNAPYIWIEQSLSWPNPADDSKIEEFLTSVNAEISSKLESLGVTSPFLYLNDADAGQPVFEGYPKQNVERLKKIRARYDPDMIFTNLMPGGWKIEHM